MTRIINTNNEKKKKEKKPRFYHRVSGNRFLNNFAVTWFRLRLYLTTDHLKMFQLTLQVLINKMVLLYIAGEVQKLYCLCC